MTKNKKLLRAALVTSAALVPVVALSAGCHRRRGTGTETSGTGSSTGSNDTQKQPEYKEVESTNAFFTPDRKYANEDGLIYSYLDKDIKPALASNPSDQEKTIVLTVDGPQEKMYHNAIYLFMQTESFKKGYRIYLVQQGAFDAINKIATVGAADYSQVADLIYAPSDRVTDLAQAGVTMDIRAFDPKIISELNNAYHWTPAEKEQILSYGTYYGLLDNNLVSKFVTIRHNQEGIVLASNMDETETRKDLLSSEDATLYDIVKNGNGLLYTQNYWYGNGILGGYFEKLLETTKIEDRRANSVARLMNLTLYGTGTGAASGWTLDDAYKQYYQPAIAIQSRLVYPIYNAVYQMSDAEYAKSPWGLKGIDQGALKVALGFDWGAVTNNLYAWFGTNKMHYTTLGTWELQNAFKNGNVKSVFAVPKTYQNNPYLQAPGSWGYVYNVRNAKASEDRKAALRDLLLAIYSPEASQAYFKDDTKVPYVQFTQDALKANIDATEVAENAESLAFAQGLGYQGLKDFKEAFNKVGTTLSEIESKFVGDTWYTEANNPEKFSGAKALFELSSEQAETLPKDEVIYLNSQLKDSLGLQNALIDMFSVEPATPAELTKGTEAWKLNKELLKPEFYTEADGKVTYNEALQPLVDGNALHLRKIEKAVWGVDGDSKDEFMNTLAAMTVKLFDPATRTAAEAELNKFVSDLSAKGYEFISKYANKPASKEVFEKAFVAHLAAYLNNALRQSLATYVLNNIAFKKADGANSQYKLSEIGAIVDKLLKTSITKKVFNVVTSHKSLEDGGLGKFVTQAERPGVSNPQYGVVWEAWNEKTFGNTTLYSTIAANEGKNKDLTEEQFAQIMAQKLSDQMTLRLKTINASGSALLINWTQNSK
ncbi:hypothetical protein [Mycoplasma hafezii]|uniref:hypothetical protein n=1 Tax=Mycoplasma hafezii TaxID=525886 RepID=UPI003CF91536